MITALLLHCKPAQGLQTPEIVLRDIGKNWRLRSEGLVDSEVTVLHSNISVPFKDGLVLDPGAVKLSICKPGTEPRFSIYAESMK